MHFKFKDEDKEEAGKREKHLDEEQKLQTIIKTKIKEEFNLD